MSIAANGIVAARLLSRALERGSVRSSPCPVPLDSSSAAWPHTQHPATASPLRFERLISVSVEPAIPPRSDEPAISATPESSNTITDPQRAIAKTRRCRRRCGGRAAVQLDVLVRLTQTRNGRDFGLRQRTAAISAPPSSLEWRLVRQQPNLRSAIAPSAEETMTLR